jgi:hypothetical protein
MNVLSPSSCYMSCHSSTLDTDPVAPSHQATQCHAQAEKQSSVSNLMYITHTEHITYKSHSLFFNTKFNHKPLMLCVAYQQIVWFFPQGCTIGNKFIRKLPLHYTKYNIHSKPPKKWHLLAEYIEKFQTTLNWFHGIENEKSMRLITSIILLVYFSILHMQ